MGVIIYIENDPDYFQEYYYYALKGICESKDDLFYWKGLLEPYLPIDLPDHDQWLEYYQARELLMMQLHILDSLDDKKAFYELLERFYKKDYEFCITYVNRLEEDNRNDEAIKIAEKGVSLFPDHLIMELRRFLNKFYKENSKDKYKENLLFLFIQDLEWSNYESLKELCSQEEWERMFSVIIKKFSRGKLYNKDIIIRIYLKEGMFEQALEKIIKNKNLYTLGTYYKDLSTIFPKRYFEAYRKLIVPFANSNTGRTHYNEIVNYLKQMKQIKGFKEEFMELVENLKEKYKNRPAFMDEMKSI